MNLPRGFRFASTYAGIRKDPHPDLMWIVADGPCAAAGVFTQNRVTAAPVTLSRQNLADTGGQARAVIANAGNANCATPTMGPVARRTIDAVAERLSIPANEVLICSTGVIGEPLDAGAIVAALPKLEKGLAASEEAFQHAATAIMTTDTVHKVAVDALKLPGGEVRIAGMSKGAGMIHPNMATMLSFVVTDAEIAVADLQATLARAVEKTFNRISVDGDQSTNDTVFLLASGAAGVAVSGAELAAFEAKLTEVCEQLAVAIVRDGEGARHLFTIEVSGATTDGEAAQISRAVANSPLVKTAFAGEDPNWGRLISSAGASGVAFDPADVDICINGTKVCAGGFRAEFDEAEVQRSMTAPESHIAFAIAGDGVGSAKFWTCDLTEDYIRINAEYRT